MVLDPSLLPWETIKSFVSQTAFNMVVHLSKPFELQSGQKLEQITGSGSLPPTCTPQYIWLSRNVRLSRRSKFCLKNYTEEIYLYQLFLTSGML